MAVVGRGLERGYSRRMGGLFWKMLWFRKRRYRVNVVEGMIKRDDLIFRRFFWVFFSFTSFFVFNIY